jgi:glycosyltransferase involved in cell wall biosynthesis
MEGQSPAASTHALPVVSIVVPTLNEAANLPILLRRIATAMSQYAYEVLVVDDCSRDGTGAVCMTLAGDYPITLHVRQQPTGGLSGAVLYGFARSRGAILAVMDADLQHPPERLPALIEPLLSGRADFVVGSRHTPGGSVVDEWGLMRRLASWFATLLAAPFCGAVHDPMSGFFALHRETYLRAEALSPLGYKIGLELMCKCRVKSIVEVPIEFGVRVHGESKLTLRQQLDYLKHLTRLYDFYYPHFCSMARVLCGGPAEVNQRQAVAYGEGLPGGKGAPASRASARRPWNMPASATHPGAPMNGREWPDPKRDAPITVKPAADGERWDQHPAKVAEHPLNSRC